MPVDCMTMGAASLVGTLSRCLTATRSVIMALRSAATSSFAVFTSSLVIATFALAPGGVWATADADVLFACELSRMWEACASENIPRACLRP